MSNQIIRYAERVGEKPRKIASLPAESVEEFIDRQVAAGRFGVYEVYKSKYAKKPYWTACRPRLRQ